METLGNLLESEGKHAEAESLLHHVVIRPDSHLRSHKQRYASCLVYLCEPLFKQEKYDEVEQLFQRILEMGTEHASKKHQWTLSKVLQYLISIYENWDMQEKVAEYRAMLAFIGALSRASDESDD